MRNLTPPDFSDNELLLSKIIARKKKEDLKKVLEKHKDYMIKRYSIYEKNKNSLENISNSNIVNDDEKKAIHSTFNDSFKVKLRNEIIVKAIKECSGKCPYCGREELKSIDHYLPKDLYPEFTVYPLNLIPVCTNCNSIKGDFLKINNERRIINFYFDKLPNEKFLFANIAFDNKNVKNTTKISFEIRQGKIDKEIFEIIEGHFNRFNLINEYKERAIHEISEFYEIQKLNFDEKVLTKEVINKTLDNQIKFFIKTYGVNFWRTALYEAIKHSNYIDTI